MARKIVITSGKGGVGKTTICAGIGQALASCGFRVALIDCDMGLNNLDVVLGLENRVVFDLVDVVEMRCRAKQALVCDESNPLLYLLASNHNLVSGKITGENLNSVIESIEGNFDYILIDCPAGVEGGFHRAVFPADEAIIVVTPHISSIRDADKVLDILVSYNIASKNLVVNRVRGDMLLTGEMISAEDIMSFLKIPILGCVPEDDEFSAIESDLSCLSNESIRAFSLLAENLHNGTRKIYDCTVKYRGFWGSVRRSLKRKI